jgi:hypothetical protein
MSEIDQLKNYDGLVSLSRVNRIERQTPFRNDRKGRVDQRQRNGPYQSRNVIPTWLG